jgi:hypothetical protein
MEFVDRLKIGWEILTRIDPSLRNRPNPFITDSMADLPKAQEKDLSDQPGLRAYLAIAGPLPPYSIVIGQCEDDAPLFLNLTDARAGSLLIIGDHQSGKTRLVETILNTGRLLNPPRRVRYALVVQDLTEYQELLGRPHCYKAFPLDSDETLELIVELVETVEQRRMQHSPGSAILFVVDDLAKLLETLDEDVLEQLRWLIQNGPEARVWTVATLNASDAERVDANLIGDFGIRLLGQIEADEVVAYLSGSEEASTAELEAGQQFTALLGDDWVKFSIPAAKQVEVSP